MLVLIAGSGLFYVFMGDHFLSRAVREGRTSTPLDFKQKVTQAAAYAQVAELLSWTTILSIEISFLIYFRILVDRLYKIEL